MFTHKIKKLPKQTIEIEVTIPWKEVSAENAKAFEALHKEFAFEGFRKGKVPKDIAEKHIPKESVYNHMLRGFLPKIYSEIVTKENLKPIMSPRVDLKKAKEDEDWEMTIKTAEKPEVKLGKYKEAVAKAKADAKKADIWVPGKDGEKKAQTEEQANQAQFQAGLEALLKAAQCEISDLIIEEEMEQRLARLVDEVQKIGLTIDSYLKSRNTTIEDLKKDIAKEIEETYKMEFILQEVADTEDIKVDQKDLEALFGHIKDEKEKAMAEQNAYYYASMMRKQKVLEYLNSL